MKKTFYSCLLATLAISGTAPAQVLFNSNMDTNAGWAIFQETNPAAAGQAAFGYNYAAAGIPNAPNGSTSGLRLAVNAGGVVGAVTAATTATFSDPFYRVTFDFWGNSAGAFPAGGTGSTELLGGGVGFSGTSPRAGASLLTSIEGGIGATSTTQSDWRLDKGATRQTLASGVYNPAISSLDNGDAFFSAAFPGQTPPGAQGALFPSQTGTLANGTVGFKWYTMQIDVDTAAGSAAFTIIDPVTSNSFLIGTLSSAGGAVPVSGSGSLTLLDSFAGASNASLDNDLVFALFDNYTVTAIPEPASLSLLGLAALRLRRRGRGQAAV